MVSQHKRKTQTHVLLFCLIYLIPTLQFQKPCWTKHYLNWASNLNNTAKEEISKVKHARKSLLFNNGKSVMF
jgi:hypothetical protein